MALALVTGCGDACGTTFCGPNYDPVAHCEDVQFRVNEFGVACEGADWSHLEMDCWIYKDHIEYYIQRECDLEGFFSCLEDSLMCSEDGEDGLAILDWEQCNFGC